MIMIMMINKKMPIIIIIIIIITFNICLFLCWLNITQDNYKASTKTNMHTVQTYGYDITTWTKSNKKNKTHRLSTKIRQFIDSLTLSWNL